MIDRDFFFSSLFTLTMMVFLNQGLSSIFFLPFLYPLFVSFRRFQSFDPLAISSGLWWGTTETRIFSVIVLSNGEKEG